MGIFSRTRDIFAANMTELLDRSDDPAKMIRMIILEMEETLVEVGASAARCIADVKDMRRALNRLDELQRSWTETAELADSTRSLATPEPKSGPAPRRAVVKAPAMLSFLASDQCQIKARRMMTGIGTPSSQSRIPRPMSCTPQVRMF